MADDCLFCRIIQGRIPSQKVYEDPRVTAILDINPVAPGHTLVLPREHHATFTDLPGPLLAELAARTQQVARGVMRATGAPGFNLLMNNHRCSGQAVFHAHWHVIPRREGDGVSFHWAPGKYGDGEMERTAESIRKALL